MDVGHLSKHKLRLLTCIIKFTLVCNLLVALNLSLTFWLMSVGCWHVSQALHPPYSSYVTGCSHMSECLCAPGAPILEEALKFVMAYYSAASPSPPLPLPQCQKSTEFAPFNFRVWPLWHIHSHHPPETEDSWSSRYVSRGTVGLWALCCGCVASWSALEKVELIRLCCVFPVRQSHSLCVRVMIREREGCPVG